MPPKKSQIACFVNALKTHDPSVPFGSSSTVRDFVSSGARIGSPHI